MKTIGSFSFGVIIGLALAVFITSTDAVAPWYSQAIYDCGIRVASGVSSGTISNALISGHRFGYCQDALININLTNLATQTK